MITINETIQWVTEEYAHLIFGESEFVGDERAYEAVMTILSTLEYSKLLEDKFRSLEEALEAEKVIKCERCYHYDPENLLCHRYGLERPVLMLDQGYCSCGIDKDAMEDMLEKCRAAGGWCTPGIILSSNEVKKLLEKENKDEN